MGVNNEWLRNGFTLTKYSLGAIWLIDKRRSLFISRGILKTTTSLLLYIRFSPIWNLPCTNHATVYALSANNRAYTVPHCWILNGNICRRVFGFPVLVFEKVLITFSVLCTQFSICAQKLIWVASNVVRVLVINLSRENNGRLSTIFRD